MKKIWTQFVGSMHGAMKAGLFAAIVGVPSLLAIRNLEPQLSMDDALGCLVVILTFVFLAQRVGLVKLLRI